jgi:chromosome segregation ATPase
MNTRMHPTPPVHHDLDETAELPVLDLDAQRAVEAEVAAAATAPEPAAPEPAARDTQAQEAAAQEAEIGSLRTSLATATETRGQLEGSLQKLTSSLRDLEERLHRKSDQLSIFEREVGARDRHIAELETDIKTRAAAAQALQSAHDALAVELHKATQELTAAQDARRRVEEEHSALKLTHSLAEVRIARAETDAAEQQRRGERYREQLQSLEGRRQLFDAMLGEREQLLAERDARIALLESEVAERTQHAGARESDLVAELGTERERAQLLEAALERARAEIDALTRRTEQARADSDGRFAAAEQRIHELDRALTNAAHDAGVREGEIHARLDTEQARAQELAASLERLGGERAALDRDHVAAQERIAALDTEVQEYGEMVRALHEQLGNASGRAETLGADLLAAEDRIRTLESDLRARDGTIERLERAEQEARARIEDVGRSLEERNALIGRLEAEAASSAAVLGNIQENLERLGQDGASPEGSPETGAREAPPGPMLAAVAHTGAANGAANGAGNGAAQLPFDQVARLLVRTEGDSGIVHVLGRRTSIGRTADNDMRIEADFISRHHAVVLATTTGTVIEDLHSTNGVFVNGVKVSRHRLVEGDLVTIGRTEFRYITKPNAERPAQ